MNYEMYHYFIAIVEAGNLSQAAVKLHIAQPALSSRIRILEREFGTQLIVMRRGARRVELTDAGNVLYRQAKRLLEADREIRQAVAAAADGRSGILRIAVAPARVPQFVSRYLSPYIRLYPAVRFFVREVSHPEIFEMVLNETAEIGIANTPLPSNSQLEIIFSQPEPLIAIGRNDCGWLKKGNRIDFSDLTHLPLAMAAGHAERLEKLAAEEKIKLDIRILTGSRQTLLKIAEEGIAVAVTSEEHEEKLVDCLIALPLKLDVSFSKTVFMRREHILSAAMRNFLDFILEIEKTSFLI